MARWRAILAFSSVTFGVMHCSPQLGMLEAPSQVRAGHEFTVTIHANDPRSAGGGTVGCVVQLPNGVAITDFVPVSNTNRITPPTVTQNTPALLALYTPEPGHYLASFEATLVSTNGALTLMLQTPNTMTGPFTVKTAIAGDWNGWTALDPVGVTDFAAIGGRYAASIGVGAAITPFARELGLPAGLDSVAFGDLDGDGNDDVVGVNRPTGTGGFLRACLSRPGAPWQVVTTTFGPGAAYDIAVGDFDGDDLLDVALPDQIWFGNGNGTFTPGPSLNPGAFRIYVDVGDVDRDGFDDVAIVASPGIAKVFRSNGDRTFSDWSTGLPASTSGTLYLHRPLLHDVTGDGTTDLVLPDASPQITVYAGNGQGQWTPGPPLSPAANPGQVAVGDLTGDGIDDLVVALRSPTLLCQVFEHRGGNVWALANVPPIQADNASGLALLDYDRDGLLDIAAADSPGFNTYSMWCRLRLLRNTGPGGFVEVADSGLTAFGVQDLRLATGDLDGDTFPDLAAGFGIRPLVFRNMETGLSHFGAGCSGAGHAPRIDANGPPRLGTPGFALELHDGLPNGAGFLWLGFSKRYAFGQPILPFALTALGAPGCSVLTEQIAVLLVLHDVRGVATLPLPLPATPALHRLLVFAQGAALVPGANALGALFSGGLAMRLD